MITDYKREDIQKLVHDGIAPVQALRDYDVVKAIMDGVKLNHIAFDNNLSRQHIYKIKSKYMSGLK